MANEQEQQNQINTLPFEQLKNDAGWVQTFKLFEQNTLLHRCLHVASMC